jgi:hypothetical protein
MLLSLLLSVLTLTAAQTITADLQLV